MTVFGTATVRARRAHKCWWCGEAINKNDRYIRWVWVDDVPQTVKCHPECRDAWNTAARNDGAYYETGFAEHKRGSTHENEN